MFMKTSTVATEFIIIVIIITIIIIIIIIIITLFKCLKYLAILC